MEHGAIEQASDVDLNELRSRVSSLPSVLRCEIDTVETGELRGLRILARPATSPNQLSKTVSAFVDRVLDVKLDPDRIAVEVSERAEATEFLEDFYGGGRGRGQEREAGGEKRDQSRPSGPGDLEPSERRERSGAGEPTVNERKGSGEGTPGAEAEKRRQQLAGSGSDPGPPRGCDGPEAVLRSGEPDRAPDPDPDRRADEDQRPRTPAPEKPEKTGDSAFPSLELEEYGIFGGGGPDVELRVRIRAGPSRYEGTARARSIQELTPAHFVDAALRALERVLDDRGTGDRSRRILILEADELEEMELDAGRFMAVTVLARHRGGTRAATGLQPISRGRPEDAARAALEAVTNLLRGRDNPTNKPNEPAGPEGGAPGSNGPYDPFGVWS